MLYILLIPVIIIVAILLLSLRLRLELSPERKLVFVGLGRSGPEIDLDAMRGRFKIFGIRIKTFSLKRVSEKKDKDEQAEKDSDEVEPDSVKAKKPETETVAEEDKGPEEKTKPKGKRRRPTLKELRAFLPKVSSALWQYITSVLRAVVIEEARGTVKAGFDEPDVTGTVYGYYQAALGAVPGVFGHVTFIPVWTERSFSASMRLSLALPLYKLIWRTIILLIKLPLREIARMAIGKKRGDEDVK